MNATVVLADDDLELAELLGRRCEHIGLNPIIVDNTYSALLAVLCEQPDLAILDVNMPSANGADVFEVLATEPELADLPVIILTGRKDDETKQSCHNLNAHYVAKGDDVWLRLQALIGELLQEDGQKVTPGRRELCPLLAEY